MDAFIQGFLVCGGLIIAIGAQNAFVLKQGLLRQHILAVILTCFACDFILISLGVFGLGTFIAAHTTSTVVLAIIGALFLLVYGGRSFRAAYRGNSALHWEETKERRSSLGQTILATLGVTLLNPHVYLDCFAIIGGIAGTLNAEQKGFFLFGALCTSALWFFSLGYGAGFLLPLFKRPHTWRILDTLIGIIMCSIAFGLIRYAFALG
ncbi:L-lysine exporter family protein LysE/ArgO [Mesocricetibacter intestinalis]|uniref:L-lysine exporter family protein LysE/ArgO n=1 Tax=Mesocricetibacter intestinalis TaxID=1521930 RepID=A0A4R6VBS1_9PAST|nr:LysE/ArgO family amino acid transporter [Mesocricetibacter intestinalis]TDQ57647.1 L-lysine exporter family protein LysE/ArgO [Mesocricetibacter intestinalis]